MTRQPGLNERQNHAGMKCIVGDQFLGRLRRRSENVVVEFDRDERRRDELRGIAGDSGSIGNILRKPDCQFTLDGKAVVVGRGQPAVRPKELMGEQAAEYGPVDVQLPSNRLAEAPDLVAADRFTAGDPQLRGLRLNGVRFIDAQAKRQIFEDTSGPMSVVVRQLPAGNLSDIRIDPQKRAQCPIATSSFRLRW